MTLKQLHIAVLLSLLGLASCKERMAVEENDGKSPIRLAVGGVDAPDTELTRAVITDGTGKTMKNFDVNSKIFMIIKSQYKSLGSGYEYLDYGGSQTTKYTVTRGDVTANSSDVVFTDADVTGKCIRYWDDAHARSSQLTIWAYAQKGQNWYNCTFEVPNSEGTGIDAYKSQEYTPGNNYKLWDESEVYPAIRYWRASHHSSDDNQDATSVQCQDLLFSNNIADYTSASGYDRRLSFDPATKHFPSKTDVWAETEIKKTEMKFYHAMSKITIHIKKGSGFDTGDFGFTGSGNIELNGFNKKGLFHIGDGQFEYIWKHKPNTTTDEETEANAFRIPQIYNWQTPATGDAMTLEALVIPNVHGNVTGLTDTHSRFVSGSADVLMEFTINNNKYQITSGQLYSALHGQAGATEKSDNGTYIPMEAGKNYVFTFTIGKQPINNITAKVAAWENVVATGQDPSNAYVHVSVKTDEGTAVQGTPSFDLYRAPGATYTGSDYDNYADYTWEKGYEKSTSLAETSTNSGVYKTEWYWPDNKTFYHFRTISPTSESISGNETMTYISMTGGVIKEGSITAKDYVWGAPFKTDSPSPDVYSFTSGYCNNETKANGQLYKAIGATTENITLIQHHMTSQVFVDLENDNTVTEANRVNITGATVQLINIAQNAKLYLGNGLVTEYSNFGDVTMTADAHAAASPIPAYDYSYGVLPQQLSNNNGTKKVGIKITTTDGNVYIIDDIKTIKIGGNAITEWLPGRKYYYKFTLKKSGIIDITATIVDWENISADNEDVTIK